MCFIFASFGFHNSSYDLGSKGPAVKSVIVCLHKRRLLGLWSQSVFEFPAPSLELVISPSTFGVAPQLQVKS